ncbi:MULTISPECIES: transposase [Streptomyces]|uniref:Transposase n=1 Tax=Streptomyces bacillaris TaxID=68179 RepID=A0ABW6DPM4_9ACTN|nr:transposase [Streptomyces nanshensis]
MTHQGNPLPPLRRTNSTLPEARVPGPRVPLPGAGRFTWLAPMVLWPLARRHLPRPAVRPQGGGSQRADDEATFAAILFVLVSGVPWRALPRAFTVSWQNTHRRFTQWSAAGLWDQLRESAHRQHAPGQSRELVQWAETVCELAEERLNRTAPPSAGPAAAARRAGSLQPHLRVREPDDFTVRLFGPGRDSAW